MVPSGRISTYSDIARFLGKSSYYSRAVGNALNRNPLFPAVPCHRIIRSNACVGGFAWGSKNKEELLRKEGIKIKDGKVVNFPLLRFRFHQY